MVQPNASITPAVRALFFIDPESQIRAIIYYPLSTGRNMQEIKRLVIDLQKNDAENVATPEIGNPERMLLSQLLVQWKQQKKD